MMNPIDIRPASPRFKRWLAVAWLTLHGSFAPTAFADVGLTTGTRLTLVDAAGVFRDSMLVEFESMLHGIPVANPTCPAADGQLIVSDDDEVFTATLPCAHWTPSRVGFTYNDDLRTTGIQRVVLADHQILIEGGGRGYGSRSMGGPSRFVQVELRFADERYCGRFEAPGSTFESNTATVVIARGPTASCLPSTQITCAPLAGPLEETCTVTPGGLAKLLIGDVLGPDLVYHGGQVLVSPGGTITCVGCDCASQARVPTRVRCPRGVISPGLINTHDHLNFAHNHPHADTGERYEHRHDWRVPLPGHTEIPTDPTDITNDQKRWAEVRFLMGGTTATAGGGAALGLLRNLDRPLLYQQGLGQEPALLDVFPLHDNSGVQISSGCGYSPITQASTLAGEAPYLAHVAEGIDAFARNEFACLSTFADGGQDLVQSHSTFIHAIALRPSDYAVMAQDGTALGWSPRSNIALYGDTAVVTAAARVGARIVLGTDWIISGSMNLLRELRCADQLNQVYFGGYFKDEALWRMVTSDAAAVLAADDVIGSLAGGRVADIAIFDGTAHPDHRAVIAADPQDVLLVMRGGKVLYGDEATVTNIPGAGVCDTVEVCGTLKKVCLGEFFTSYVELQSDAGAIYPAFFCGTPPDEPTCVPARDVPVDGSTKYTGLAVPGDVDGDGIPDASDNCPGIFNPVRPVDNGSQADEDQDGVGDACDPFPLP